MITLAKKVRNILIKEGVNGTLDSPIDSESKRIPYIHTFPKNCCEHASYLLGATIKESYPKANISIVTGKYKNEKHYWLTVDDIIFDITIDQFPEYTEPLFGVNNKSLKKANSVKSVEICDAFSKWDQPHKFKWLEFIQTQI